jgi:hypothetical protein
VFHRAHLRLRRFRSTVRSKLPLLGSMEAEVAVALGTTIADRPLRSSVRRVYAYGSYERMDGVEANLRIRVQDFRARYPSFE